MSNRAWVTLATNDSYGLGALVLAHSLRRVDSVYSAVVLITPAVTDAMRNRLHAVFSEVVLVDVLDSRDAAHLALLQRPELGITFTKIHCWSLTQYEKCVFLDADALIVQNCDELFEREELSAAPDVGWPDCFNSGVFVYKPSQETFDALIKFAKERGSFDGGDQGLLNSFFSDWAHGDINKHLPFLYNVTSAAFYSYLPALKHYGENLKIIHFIGATKPWLQSYNWESHSVDAPGHLKESLQMWWDIFVSSVHPQLDLTMSGVAGNLARVVPGAPAQREAIDELTRRQGWEAGNIDYMGADSFDNIWAKISETLNQAPKQSTPPPKEPSPPKQPSPPKEQPAAPQPQSTPAKEPSPPKQQAPSIPVTPEQSVPVKSEDGPEKTEPLVFKEETKSVVAPDTTVKEPSPVASTKVEEKKAESPAVPPIPPVTPSKSTPETLTPVSEVSAIESTEAKPKEEKTPEKSLEASATSTDSPPLANTPSKEDAPLVPKSTEEAAQETRL